MSNFIGRQRELKQLKELFKKKTAHLVVVKGRRRIGKSRLVEEFARDFKFLSFSGLPPTEGVTAQHQRDEFARQLGRQFYIPIPYSADWSDLFWYLAHHTQEGKCVILLDEISWMGFKDPTFLGKLKTAWDLHFKKNTELMLVLCGSVSSWIEKNILSSTGFVGRIDLILTLKELNLQECNEFWGSHKDQWSAYEKLKLLSVTGGVPRYLELMDPQSTAENNIKDLCFVEEGFLFAEFDQLFHDLFAKRSPLYEEILLTLSRAPSTSLEDLFQRLGIKKSGTMSEYLEDLVLAGFLQRDYTWTLHSGAPSKLSHFRISDNYIRFYLKYVLPNKNNIERGSFQERSLTTFPGWDTLMGLQFENLVLRNRFSLQRLFHIAPDEIVNDNPYFQRQTKTHKGCQIDYMIQTRFNCLYVCEMKFSRHPVGPSVVGEVKAKIEALNLPKHFSYRPILIHVNGVEDEVIANEFFAHIVDFGQLIEPLKLP